MSKFFGKGDDNESKMEENSLLLNEILLVEGIAPTFKRHLYCCKVATNVILVNDFLFT
jgi:hypothetical protein